jgi:hypothetical protein
VDPTVGSDAMKQLKSYTARNLTQTIQPVARPIPTELSGFPITLVHTN